MVKVNQLILIALVIIGAMMAYKIFSEDSSASDLNRAYAAGGAIGTSEIIAIPVLGDSNSERLWILKKQSVKREGAMTPEEWHMVIYSFEGRKLKIEAARLIEFDFIFPEYNTDSPKGMKPLELRDKLKKDEEKDNKDK